MQINLPRNAAGTAFGIGLLALLAALATRRAWISLRGPSLPPRRDSPIDVVDQGEEEIREPPPTEVKPRQTWTPRRM